MRPAEFPTEAIIEAGQALRQAGRNITGFALRQKVGGGNPSRLKQVWDEHINSQTVTNAEPVSELPVEVAAVAKALTERLAALAVELNDKAVKAAERRVAEVIRTAGEQREQAERELADASQTVEDLEAALDEAKAKEVELEKRLVDTQTVHQAQAVELAQVRERLTLTEQSAKTAAQEAHRVAERMTMAEADRDTARKEASSAREDAAKLSGQVESLQIQASDLMRTLSARASAEVEADAAPKASGKNKSKSNA